jgi:hypothetical protein
MLAAAATVPYRLIDPQPRLSQHIPIAHDTNAAGYLQACLLRHPTTGAAAALRPGPGHCEAVAFAIAIGSSNRDARRQINVKGNLGPGGPRWGGFVRPPASARRFFHLESRRAQRPEKPANLPVAHLESEEPNFCFHFGLRSPGAGCQSRTPIKLATGGHCPQMGCVVSRNGTCVPFPLILKIRMYLSDPSLGDLQQRNQGHRFRMPLPPLIMRSEQAFIAQKEERAGVIKRSHLKRF